MKNENLVMLLLVVILSACSQNEVDDLKKVDQNKIEILSGSFLLSELPKTVIFGDKSITFEVIDTLSDIKTKAAPNWQGPFYVSGIAKNTNAGVQKVRILSDPSLVPGVYLCEIWRTAATIILPSNAYAGKIGMPNPAGYINYETQEQGINWSMSTGSNGLQLNWNFATLLVKYDSLGRTWNRAVPLDGSKIRVPYYYLSE